MEPQLIALVTVAVLTTAVTVVRQERRKSRLRRDLVARGIPIVNGDSGLPVAPWHPFGKRPIAWAAVVPGPLVVQLHGFASVIMVAWRTAIPVRGAFVVAPTPCFNPDSATLRETPRKQLPAKGVQLFTSDPALEYEVLATSIVPALATCMAGHRGWRFYCTGGSCYLSAGHDGGFAGLDDALDAVTALEAALAGAPGQRAAG